MKTYYLLGICGISMSALAIFLKNEGNIVYGSDIKVDNLTKNLVKNGIYVSKRTNFNQIDKSDVIVVSSAIKNDNKALIYSKNKQKVIKTRGEILGEISKKYKKVIAIAGSHGKTTTTAMIFSILKYAKKNPSLHIGGVLKEFGTNYFIGDKDYFITEACEYCDNFLALNPDISVITNIEKEHLDYFKTFERQLESFERFKEQSRCVFEEDLNYKIKNLSRDEDLGLRFDIFYKNEKLINLKLNMYEKINAHNCIYAYRVAKKLNIADADIKNALLEFKGIRKRFEKVESNLFENVFCDYAHHPTEILKAIESGKEISKNKKLLIIFQPHTYSRTKLLFENFVDIFKNCDDLILYKTFPAREKANDGISAYQLYKYLKKYNKKLNYFNNFSSVKRFLMKFDKKETVLLFIGAGDLPEILNKNKFIS